MHPASRMVLVKHLDKPSLNAVIHAIRVAFTGVAKKEKCFPPNVERMLKRLVKKNPRTFKALLHSDSSKVTKAQQAALFNVGGSVIGAILSVVVPYVIGQLMKK